MNISFKSDSKQSLEPLICMKEQSIQSMDSVTKKILQRTCPRGFFEDMKAIQQGIKESKRIDPLPQTENELAKATERQTLKFAKHSFSQWGKTIELLHKELIAGVSAERHVSLAGEFIELSFQLQQYEKSMGLYLAFMKSYKESIAESPINRQEILFISKGLNKSQKMQIVPGVGPHEDQYTNALDDLYSTEHRQKIITRESVQRIGLETMKQAAREVEKELLKFAATPNDGQGVKAAIRMGASKADSGFNAALETKVSDDIDTISLHIGQISKFINKVVVVKTASIQLGDKVNWSNYRKEYEDLIQEKNNQFKDVKKIPEELTALKDALERELSQGKFQLPSEWLGWLQMDAVDRRKEKIQAINKMVDDLNAAWISLESELEEISLMLDLNKIPSETQMIINVTNEIVTERKKHLDGKAKDQVNWNDCRDGYSTVLDSANEKTKDINALKFRLITTKNKFQSELPSAWGWSVWSDVDKKKNEYTKAIERVLTDLDVAVTSLGRELDLFESVVETQEPYAYKTTKLLLLPNKLQLPTHTASQPALVSPQIPAQVPA